MSRFLFVVAPLARRVWPTTVIGRQLVERGHDVVWAMRHALPDRRCQR
jgi:UDP:flavonoid glycosyltransferase YjiC (YdhE family)